jgi:hypothetical protein
VFAEILILPWEDRQEFAKLHAALVEEWKPAGPTEQDAVFSIAKGMWRKRRMPHFLNSEIERCRVNPYHAAYDEAHMLRFLSDMVVSEPDQFDRLLTSLRNDTADHLRRKFPRGD